MLPTRSWHSCDKVHINYFPFPFRKFYSLSQTSWHLVFYFYLLAIWALGNKRSNIFLHAFPPIYLYQIALIFPLICPLMGPFLGMLPINPTQPNLLVLVTKLETQQCSWEASTKRRQQTEWKTIFCNINHKVHQAGFSSLLRSPLRFTGTAITGEPFETIITENTQLILSWLEIYRVVSSLSHPCFVRTKSIMVISVCIHFLVPALALNGFSSLSFHGFLSSSLSPLI